MVTHRWITESRYSIYSSSSPYISGSSTPSLPSPKLSRMVHKSLLNSFNSSLSSPGIVWDLRLAQSDTNPAYDAKSSALLLVTVIEESMATEGSGECTAVLVL